jgi:hypothetical protein
LGERLRGSPNLICPLCANSGHSANARQKCIIWLSLNDYPEKFHRSANVAIVGHRRRDNGIKAVINQRGHHPEFRWWRRALDDNRI